MTNEVQGRAKGGKARAERLTGSQRSDIARKAAETRWSEATLRATHEGVLKIGGIEIPCAVLNNGERVLTQTGFLQALGRTRASGKRPEQIEDVPAFLKSKNLQRFIPSGLTDTHIRKEFIPLGGSKAVGYSADLLPQVCEIILDADDAGVLQPNQKHIAVRAKILFRSLAKIGIVGLIDEATGFQRVRDREALQALLDAYLRKELAAWAKRFPDEFYDEIFRLKGWSWRRGADGRTNPPQVVGKYTNNIVYDRLAPEILEELEMRNPKDVRGNRKTKHHQWLTEDVGHPALAQHLHAVMGIMRLSKNWEDFLKLLDRAFPKKTVSQITQQDHL
jgi:hypothetical protein